MQDSIWLTAHLCVYGFHDRNDRHADEHPVSLHEGLVELAVYIQKTIRLLFGTFIVRYGPTCKAKLHPKVKILNVSHMKQLGNLQSNISRFFCITLSH